MRTRFQGLFKILKLMFRQDFEAEVWLLFCCWCLILAIKFIVGRDSGLVLSKWWCLVEILKLMQGRDSEDVWSRFVFELVIWPKEVTLVSRTQPSGPLCLWQCFEIWSASGWNTLNHLSSERPWLRWKINYWKSHQGHLALARRLTVPRLIDSCQSIFWIKLWYHPVYFWFHILSK